MTLRVPAASIAPDLRFGAAAALGDPSGAAMVGEVMLRVEGCLPRSTSIPRYLRYADRDAVIVAYSVDSLGQLESRLGERIQVSSACGDLDDLGAVVLLLDAVDRCFRESGLWPGNIYLAGCGALTAVLGLVQDAEVVSRGADAVLRELAALELAYLFPIAGKFRSGEYDGQVQYRLNGWGRVLARRLTAGRMGAARADSYRRRISQHLASEHRRYGSFLGELDVARESYDGDRLDGALRLPIPVLV
jgi:hypothetical protein